MSNETATFKTLIKLYNEMSKHWHLACNYERINPENKGIVLTDNNPHKRNYEKALAKLNEESDNVERTENPCV